MDTLEYAGEAASFRSAIEMLDLNQSSFAGLLSELGDNRGLKTILRSIQRMVGVEARVSGEMQVIVTLLVRDRARARRIADAIEWTQRDGGGFAAEIQGVKLTIAPQSRGRWSIHARHVATGADGYSPSVPHWRNNVDDAKIRAVMAVDETLDHVERFAADR